MSNLDKIKKDGIEYGLIDASLRDLIFFKPGETATLTDILCHGYVRGAGTNLYINVILPKHIDFTTGVNILSFKMNARHVDGGYIDQDGGVTGGVEYVGRDGYVIEIAALRSNSMTVKIVKQTEFLNVVNNTPISADVNQIILKFD